MDAYSNKRVYVKSPAKAVAVSGDGAVIAYALVTKVVDAAWVLDGKTVMGPVDLPAPAAAVALDENGRVLVVGVPDSSPVGESGLPSAPDKSSSGAVLCFGRLTSSPRWTLVSVMNSTPKENTLPDSERNPRGAFFGSRVKVDSGASVIAVSGVNKLSGQVTVASGGYASRLTESIEFDKRFQIVSGAGSDGTRVYTCVAKENRALAIGVGDSVFVSSAHSLSEPSVLGDLANSYARKTIVGYRCELKVPTELPTYTFGECEISGDGSRVAVVLMPHDKESLAKIGVYRSDEAWLTPQGKVPFVNPIPLVILDAPLVKIGSGFYTNTEVDSIAISHNGNRVAAIFPNVGRVCVYDISNLAKPKSWVSSELFLRRAPGAIEDWVGVGQVVFCGKSDAIAIASIGGVGVGVSILNQKTPPKGEDPVDTLPLPAPLVRPPPPPSIDTSSILKSITKINVG